MKVRLWGTRGSIASSGPGTVGYGGDTSAVEVRDRAGNLIVLDAGTGLRAIGADGARPGRVDILISHLHMDHIQGLPFFRPVLDPDIEAHIWGPGWPGHPLKEALARYLSPPLFPVRIREMDNVWFHDVEPGRFTVGEIEVTADLVCHPGATLGFRLDDGSAVLAFLPDHEPALANPDFSADPEWTSGSDLAAGVDLLVHDAQYTDEEYRDRVGWGHSAVSHLATFADRSGPSILVPFHHDPAHTDEKLDSMWDGLAGDYRLIPGKAGTVIDLG